MKAAIYARKSTIFAAFLTLTLSPLLVSAGDKNGYFQSVIGKDERTCGSYVLARDEGRRGSFEKQNNFATWLAGYLTGYNQLMPDTYDIKGNSDMNSLLLWLENYCKKNPLEDFISAVDMLVNELHPKRHKQAPKG